IVLLNTFIERFPENKAERKRENIITGPLPTIYEILFKSGCISSFLVNHLDVFRQFVWLKWRTGNPSKALGAGFRRAVDPRAMEQYRLPTNSRGSRSGVAAFAKQIPNHPGHENAEYIDEIRQVLEDWNIPAIVIFPDGDMAWKPEEGRQIADVMIDAEFHLVKNTGHYIQEDAAKEVSQLMINFLDKYMAARKTMVATI
ncbi:MAG: alpha/beta fold hydrolase, partial [Gammaproteobacteria bacterium]